MNENSVDVSGLLQAHEVPRRTPVEALEQTPGRSCGCCVGLPSPVPTQTRSGLSAQRDGPNALGGLVVKDGSHVTPALVLRAKVRPTRSPRKSLGARCGDGDGRHPATHGARSDVSDFDGFDQLSTGSWSNPVVGLGPRKGDTANSKHAAKNMGKSNESWSNVHGLVVVEMESTNDRPNALPITVPSRSEGHLRASQQRFIKSFFKTLPSAPSRVRTCKGTVARASGRMTLALEQGPHPPPLPLHKQVTLASVTVTA